MKYLIGIDVGTSSAKTVLIEETGKVVFTVAPEYTFSMPQQAWVEANPEDWWQATVQSLQALFEQSGVSAEDISGIGLTGQMHGLVLLDAEGEVLRPCIMWNDQRTVSQCQQLTDKVGAEKVLEITGNPILPGFTAPKILWVQENEPEIFARVDKILLPKDYIRYRLSGQFFTDVSDASGTSLLDVANRNWSEAMCDACGVSSHLLPQVTESTEVTSAVTREVAAITGLKADTPIVAGGGDQAAQAVGCGIVKEGVVSATLGTSGVVFAHSDKYRVEPEGRLHAFCAAVPGKWHLMGVMLSAAGAFQWFKNTLGGEESIQEKTTGVDAYDALTKLAETVPAGSEGLTFLPYLSGERTPHPDPYARGVFFGLSLMHSKAHMTRAVLEGVSFGLCDSLDLMRNLGIKPQTIVASGGGAKSSFWRQMLADIFQAQIETNNATEGAAYGAAILAGVGVGIYPSVEAACEQTLVSQNNVSPDEAVVESYSKAYEQYSELYPVLKDSFARFAKA